MARANRKRRRTMHRRNRHTPRQLVKKEIMDFNEVNVKDFATHRQYTLIMRLKGGVEGFFKHDQNFRMHELAQDEHRERYIAGLLVIAFNSYCINKNVVYFALSAALARDDIELATALLSCRRFTTVREVLKAVSVLDIGRRLRAVRSKTKQLELLNIKLKTSQLPKKLTTRKFKQVAPKRRTLTGPVCKQVKRWVQSLSAEELRAYINEDKPDERTSITKVWRLLSDLCHFHPTKDFAVLPSFLPYCFGEKSAYRTAANITTPPVSELQALHINSVPLGDELKALTINQVVLEKNVPLMKICDARLTLCLMPHVKAHIVSYTNLDTLFKKLDEVMCEPVDIQLAARVRAEGAVLAVRDGIPLLTPILEYIQKVISIRKKIVPAQRVQFQDGPAGFRATYHDTDRNIGLKTLAALEELLETRIQETKAKITLPGTFLVIMELMTGCGLVHEEDEAEFVLNAGTLAMLTESEVFGATGCEITTHQVTTHRFTNAAEIIALSQKPWFQNPDNEWSSIEVIKRLHKEKTVVPIIALVLKEKSVGTNPNFIDSLLDAMQKYSKDVHPCLFLILAYPNYHNDLPMLNKITKSDVNSLIYTHSMLNPLNIIDQIVKLMTSSVTALKSVEHQMSDVIKVLKDDGVMAAFERMVGQVPMKGPGPSGQSGLCDME